MTGTLRLSLVAVSVAVVAGCPAGSGRGGSGGSAVAQDFECNDRRIEYIVAGGFAADEAGVAMQCTDNLPTVVQWTQDAGEERASSSHRIPSTQFDTVWEKVDSTGWRHIDEECDNPDVRDTDPVYTIEAADHAMTRTLSCQGKELPFPYNRLVNELDVLAAGL